MNVVILAGGQGNRLWPRSAADKPKQFLPILSEQTLLQMTYRSLARLLPAERLHVATLDKYRPIVLEQLPELSEDRLIVEPVQRDTAPCVALCALRFLRRGDDEALVMLPSDHYIPDTQTLVDALRKAEKVAAEPGKIVTLGIVPTRPETSYGYIRASEPPDGLGARRVGVFIEKPDAATAEQLIRSVDVYWNSGIFIWRPSTIARSMERFQPLMWNALVHAGSNPEQAYAALPKLSIDYAVLEKADSLFTIPVQFGWDDVGSWTALERMNIADNNGNVIQGPAIVSESTDSIVFGDGRPTIVVGADRLIVVSTPEGLLICHKSKEALLKELVQRLNAGPHG